MATVLPQDLRAAPRSRLTSNQVEGLISFLTGSILTAVLVYGWLHRADKWIDPDTGIGYWLGIIGGSLMLLLLVYPFRKRIRLLKAIGSVGFWFRFHMLLGLLGPLAILYHARYSWGALNSTVAMTAMLIVAGSGLIGRFLYSRVHRGYSGRKLEMRAMLGEMHEVLDGLAGLGEAGARVQARLVPFEQQAVAAGSGFWTSAGAVLGIGVSTRRAQMAVRRELKSATTSETRNLIVAQSATYLHSVRRAAEFAFYDRMLRLWHLLHLPLFFILVATAIIHVIAVHMY